MPRGAGKPGVLVIRNNPGAVAYPFNSGQGGGLRAPSLGAPGTGNGSPPSALLGGGGRAALAGNVMALALALTTAQIEELRTVAATLPRGAARSRYLERLDVALRGRSSVGDGEARAPGACHRGVSRFPASLVTNVAVSIHSNAKSVIDKIGLCGDLINHVFQNGTATFQHSSY